MENDLQRRDQAKAYHEQQARRGRPKKGKDSPIDKYWYEVVGNKVLKKTRMKTGTTYSDYICDKSKAESLFKKAEKDGIEVKKG